MVIIEGVKYGFSELGTTKFTSLYYKFPKAPYTAFKKASEFKFPAPATTKF